MSPFAIEARRSFGASQERMRAQVPPPLNAEDGPEPSLSEEPAAPEKPFGHERPVLHEARATPEAPAQAPEADDLLPGRPAANDEPRPLSEAPAPVSILKSGVVEGMAYTVYSDGSIEAQFANGTMRFASINELRDHIEKNEI